MDEPTKEEIESYFVETIAGFYLKECAKKGGDAEGFYQNQLSVFTDGFKCCLEKAT